MNSRRHAGAAVGFARASHVLATAGEVLFLATVLLVFCKLILLAAGVGYEGRGDRYSSATPAPPLVGIRSYAEFDLMAGQFSRMIAEMRAVRLRASTTEANASQRVAAVVRSVTDTMLLDVQVR